MLRTRLVPSGSRRGVDGEFVYNCSILAMLKRIAVDLVTRKLGWMGVVVFDVVKAKLVNFASCGGLVQFHKVLIFLCILLFAEE